MTGDTYQRLRAFLDRQPAGFPATESGVELRILQKLFTPREAELATSLRMFPEPASEIARRSGASEAEAAKALESMAGKGLILRLEGGDRVYYQALQFLIGIYEYSVDRMDREMAELCEEYMPHIKHVTTEFRVVPVNAAVDTTKSIATFDMARELVKGQDRMVEIPCICRMRQRELGHGCDHTAHNCIIMGVAAQHFIDQNVGRRIGEEEALRLLDIAEEEGLVLQPANMKESFSICCCCSCCCEILNSLKKYDSPAEQVYSSFQALVDPELCTSCEACLDRCPMDAVAFDAGAMRVDVERCIGCGLCISTCESGAVSLVVKDQARPVPNTYLELLAMLSAGRGMPLGKMGWAVRYTSTDRFIRTVNLLYRLRIARPIANIMARLGLA